MNRLRFILLCCLLLNASCWAIGQTKKSAKAEKWEVIKEDEVVTISYNPDVVTAKNGNHFVWVKAVYHDAEWQSYFARMIRSSDPVVTTRTKAEYSEIYSHVRVRQVICYSKTGKISYRSGDDTSAGWGIVNASDPVGIIGEFLGDQMKRARY